VRISPESTTVQIVLIGKFKPAVFAPEWLAGNELIGKADGKGAEVRIVHEAIADISLDWCRLIVTQEKFILSSNEGPWVRLLDFCLKLFVELLPDTPLTRLGINRVVVFDSGSMKQKDRLGRLLAPRNVWGEWGEVLEKDAGVGASGLSSLSMRQGHDLNDRKHGYIEARVGPERETFVQVAINDHYECSEEREDINASEMMELLATNFEKSLRRSDWIVDGIMAQVKA